MADNPYPWFRFYSETMDDQKILSIADELSIHPLVVVGAWSILLCIANKSPVRGSLYVTPLKRYSNVSISNHMHLSTDEANAIIGKMVEYEMVSVDEQGGYQVKNWEKRQFISDSSVLRVEKHRKNKKEKECNADVTLHVTPINNYCNADVTPPETETETESREEALRNSEDPRAEQVFQQVTKWTTFPSSERREAIDAIRCLMAVHGNGTAEYIKPFFVAAKEQYPNSTKLFWLTDWAVSGRMPNAKNSNNGNRRKPLVVIDD
jgi:hypothetical protein